MPKEICLILTLSWKLTFASALLWNWLNCYYNNKKLCLVHPGTHSSRSSLPFFSPIGSDLVHKLPKKNWTIFVLIRTKQSSQRLYTTVSRFSVSFKCFWIQVKSRSIILWSTVYWVIRLLRNDQKAVKKVACLAAGVRAYHEIDPN